MDSEDESRNQLALQIITDYSSRRRAILIDQVVPLLVELGDSFHVLDGGAGRADLVTFWNPIPGRLMNLYGFDPEEGECERLNRLAKVTGLSHKFYPSALWSKSGTVSLNVGAVDASLFEANTRLVNRWRYLDGLDMGSRIKTERKVSVPAVSIDDWMQETNVGAIDFLKLNVQGAELDILQGAAKALPNILGMQLEASFVQTYTGQPLFGDLERFLRPHGFAFFDFLAPNITGRNASPVSIQATQNISIFRWPSQQLFEGHFLWLRDPIDSREERPVEQILKLACFAELYGQVEYAFELLMGLRERSDVGPVATSERLGEMIRDATALYTASFPGMAIDVAGSNF